MYKKLLTNSSRKKSRNIADLSKIRDINKFLEIDEKHAIIYANQWNIGTVNRI